MLLNCYFPRPAPPHLKLPRPLAPPPCCAPPPRGRPRINLYNVKVNRKRRYRWRRLAAGSRNSTSVTAGTDWRDFTHVVRLINWRAIHEFDPLRLKFDWNSIVSIDSGIDWISFWCFHFSVEFGWIWKSIFGKFFANFLVNFEIWFWLIFWSIFGQFLIKFWSIFNWNFWFNSISSMELIWFHFHVHFESNFDRFLTQFLIKFRNNSKSLLNH